MLKKQTKTSNVLSMDHEAHTPFCSEDVNWDERPLLQMQQRLPSDPTSQSLGSHCSGKSNPGFTGLRPPNPTPTHAGESPQGLAKWQVQLSPHPLKGEKAPSCSSSCWWEQGQELEGQELKGQESGSRSRAAGGKQPGSLLVTDGKCQPSPTFTLKRNSSLLSGPWLEVCTHSLKTKQKQKQT